MRERAREVRDGTPAGREILREELLDLIHVKRGHRAPAGVTEYLPADVLEPFNASPDRGDTCGEHTRRFLDEIAETKE